jgi:hypothetical protein
MCFLYKNTTIYMANRLAHPLYYLTTTCVHLKCSWVRICWILGSAPNSSLGQYKAPSSLEKCSIGGSFLTNAASCDGTLTPPVLHDWWNRVILIHRREERQVSKCIQTICHHPIPTILTVPYEYVISLISQRWYVQVQWSKWIRLPKKRKM